MKNILMAFIGSFCPAVLFNINKKNLIWAGFSGMSGWIAYSLIKDNTGHIIIATFVGGIAVSLYSEIMARVLKTPAFVFSIPGIFPLVPGIPAYNTVLNFVERKYNIAAGYCLETLGMAGTIAFGVMLVSALFMFYTDLRHKKSYN